jgi:hypothetical protein
MFGLAPFGLAPFGLGPASRTPPPTGDAPPSWCVVASEDLPPDGGESNAVGVGTILGEDL